MLYVVLLVPPLALPLVGAEVLPEPKGVTNHTLILFDIVHDVPARSGTNRVCGHRRGPGTSHHVDRKTKDSSQSCKILLKSC